ncbi:rho GDP-dissociation inhibitor 1-like [Durio zibethinus]|uniref:Rho GDP-dissociation inhibitor 1-like n=1 Tax=Durio zibethinus TaxID=66656 RepID=A0A6P6AYT0_DURZI|nr:rho GDP-dissociation inhibitor 1-like [Durio zibethinus]
MSLAVGAVPSFSNMGFDDNTDKEEAEDKNATLEEKATHPQESDDEGGDRIGSRQMSESSLYATDQDDDNDDEQRNTFQLGPQCTLKEQLEKDKDDKSLRKWKEQLLGSVDINHIGETLDQEVKFLSVSIVSPDRPDMVLSIPEDGNPQGLWFTLKEGSHYHLKFSFQVGNNIVSGLRYTNTVWKTGVKLFSTKEMIGTFSPQQEPYTHEMPEETAPSAYVARGSYTAKSKFLDDNKKCYLEINYTLDIRKEWAAPN